jgi:hypothetical protein
MCINAADTAATHRCGQLSIRQGCGGSVGVRSASRFVYYSAVVALTVALCALFQNICVTPKKHIPFCVMGDGVGALEWRKERRAKDVLSPFF